MPHENNLELSFVAEIGPEKNELKIASALKMRISENLVSKAQFKNLLISEKSYVLFLIYSICYTYIKPFQQFQKLQRLMSISARGKLHL